MIFGTTVSDLQSDIVIKNNRITGTLKYYDEDTTIVHDWGEGYFIVLKFNASDWSKYTSVKVGLTPSAGTGLVEIKNDPDKNALFKLTNKSQKVTIVATDGTNTTTQYYDLNDLTFSHTA